MISILSNIWFTNILSDKLSEYYDSLEVQGNSRKGFGRCRLNCLLYYIHYLSIPMQTSSWDDIFRTLFLSSPVSESMQMLISVEGEIKGGFPVVKNFFSAFISVSYYSVFQFTCTLKTGYETGCSSINYNASGSDLSITQLTLTRSSVTTEELLCECNHGTRIQSLFHECNTLEIKKIEKINKGFRFFKLVQVVVQKII